VPTPLFSYQELLRVFRHLTSEPDAVAVARETAAALAREPSVGPARVSRDGLQYHVVSNSQLSDDVLALLSLESDELNAKVEEYRRAFRLGAPETPDERDAWLRRRQELKKWADAGYPHEEQ